MKRSLAPLFIVTGLVILGCGGSGGIATIIEDYTYFVSGNVNLVRRGDLTGNTATLFTSGAGGVFHLRLSNAQTRLVYNDGNGLRVQNSDGTGSTAIAGYKYADWSANGNQLYAVSNDNKIVTMNPDGTGVGAVLFDGNFGGGISSIDVSRDGAQIIIWYAPSGWNQVHILNADGTGINALTPTGQSATDPRWSPDGSQIFFTRQLVGQDFDIYVMNDDGTGLSPIANSTDDELQPVPRSGGSVLYTFSPMGGSREIWSMGFDGSGKASFEVEPGINLDRPEAE